MRTKLRHYPAPMLKTRRGGVPRNPSAVEWRLLDSGKLGPTNLPKTASSGFNKRLCLKYRKKGACKMVEQVKALAAKSDAPNSIPGFYVVERMDSSKL